MGLFNRKNKSESPKEQNQPQETPTTQLDRIKHAKMPVFLSKMHAEYPPRWVTVRPDRLESVVGTESPEYMDDASNHEVWSVDSFVSKFPFVEDFLNVARPGETARFDDQSGNFVIEDD